MASDDSFTHMIFFIASIVIAVSIAGTLIAVTGLMVDEVRTKGTNAASEMGSSIVISNDPRHVPHDNDTLTLYIKNTGEVTQTYQDLIIFIDGEYVTYGGRLVGTGNGQWSTGRVVEITAMIGLGPGDHTAKVILANGVSDTLEFRV
ncbi:MAG: hypothetical protein ISF22_09185 [Methanomassiliicoccus sp.]|nr:hypothetical protein [Methanomassiliicoccus sp.]